MERGFRFAPDEYYHVYNRGVDKRSIFENKADYRRFVESLYLFNSIERIVLRLVPKKDRFSCDREETIVYIGAYCLMPNHFHILIKAKSDNGVSSFMEKIQTSYSMYFNKTRQRSGSLFQGPFRAEHVTRDEYLKYLFSYIHLNPIKIIDPDWKEKGIKDIDQAKNFLLSGQFSSYQDYIGLNRQESSVLNREVFPEYFQSTKDFNDFIDFWLTFKKDVEKYT